MCPVKKILMSEAAQNINSIKLNQVIYINQLFGLLFHNICCSLQFIFWWQVHTGPLPTEPHHHMVQEVAMVVHHPLTLPRLPHHMEVTIQLRHPPQMEIVELHQAFLLHQHQAFLLHQHHQVLQEVMDTTPPLQLLAVVVPQHQSM